MKESDLNRDCSDLLLKVCPGAVVYKHADRFTAGIPDTSVTWNGFDTWLEFKLLEPLESVHSQLDKVQLVECMKLEKQGRCWVVAYRKGNPKHRTGPRPDTLEIYRPTALWSGEFGAVIPGGKNPEGWASPEQLGEVLMDLRQLGIARFIGFDHRAVAALIHLTHRRQS